ncbi:hypothetical protein [Mycobacteroides abscessus]|uniref:hypothetical protein n=1 Tax=Mycobacteroides abscessus TaxID=36809 RepID=UPI001896A195
MTFLLSTVIVFYTIVSVVFAMVLLDPVCKRLSSRLDGIAERSETLTMVAIVFGIPVMFVVLTVVWPVLLYRQIRKELADAD